MAKLVTALKRNPCKYINIINNLVFAGIDPFQTANVINTLSKLNLKDEVVDLHLGAEHGLVVIKSGEVMTWGWNEHGNCGNNSEENLYV